MSTLKTVLDHYITCALWSSCDSDGEPLDDNYSESDLAPETLERMRSDCERFITENESDLADIDDSQIGQDFWLTRNRHGAGFWDRDLGDIGDRLTEASHGFGEVDLYVGDDGKLYL